MPEAAALKSYVWGHDKTVVSAHAARNLANSSPYLLPHLRALASRGLFTVLDVGCGPGSITRDIAVQFPSARVLGIDPSAQVIAEACQACDDAGIPNCTFSVGEASTAHTLQVAGFEGHIDGAFDLVSAHQVLQHVEDPLAVLESMRAAAKPDGGLVAVREADWGMMTLHPPLVSVRAYLDLWCRVARDAGCDPDVGRKLVSLALQAGWKREQIESSLGSWLYSTPEERRWWANSTRDRFHDQCELSNRASASGYINGTADVEEMREGWRVWGESEDGWYALPCPQIVCRRGASSEAT